MPGDITDEQANGVCLKYSMSLCPSPLSLSMGGIELTTIMK